MPADLQPMAVAASDPGQYAPYAGAPAVEAVVEAARPLHGVRVLHLTVAGAQVRLSEMLRGLLALEAGAGVRLEWSVLFGDPELRRVASALNTGLRGGESAIADADWAAYLDACARIALDLESRYDLVVLHDPSALGLAPALGARAVWHCHVDASGAEEEALERAAPLAGACSGVLAPDLSFLPGPLAGDRARAVAPGIDPLDPRNLELESRLPGRVVRGLGVDLDRPFILQALELDRWDDPHATIECFRLAREEEPGLQLVLAAQLDAAATEAWLAAKEVSDYSAGTDDLLLLTSYEPLGSLELGSLQHLARVVLEQSLGEGLHLGPCEALWKRTPVVGRPDGGLHLTVRDGVDGFLTHGAEDTARRLVELVRDPGLAVEMGRAGRERVRERFLVTAAAERELRALAELA
jgi:trehalose synthase